MSYCNSGWPATIVTRLNELISTDSEMVELVLLIRSSKVAIGGIRMMPPGVGEAVGWPLSAELDDEASSGSLGRGLLSNGVLCRTNPP